MRTDVSCIIDAETVVSSYITDRPVARCYATVWFGDLSLSHDIGGDNAMTVKEFIAKLRFAADTLDLRFRQWDEERLRQCGEDAAAELDDSVLPPFAPPRFSFVDDAAHRHAPTGDHLLPDAGGF